MTKYVVVSWPDSQDLMGKPGFRENAYLVNDEKGMQVFGSSAYFVDEEWLAKAEGAKTDSEKQRYCEQTYFDVKASFEDGDKGEFDNPFTLSGGKTAIGFELDEGNEDLRILVTDDKETALKHLSEIDRTKVESVSFFGLPLDDRDTIARVIDDGEYIYWCN